MIKLTLLQGERPVQRTFFKDKVTIGCQGDLQVDFPLPIPLLEGERITILDRGCFFSLLSSVQGSVVMVDDQVVDSKETKIQTGVTLCIGSLSLRFDGICEHEERLPLQSLDEELNSLLADLNLLKKPDSPECPEQAPFDVDAELSQIQQNLDDIDLELTDECIEAWLQDVEEGRSSSDSDPVQDDNERRWRPKRLLLTCLLMLCIAAVSLWGVYKGSFRTEDTFIAQGIYEIGAALTFASEKGHTPENRDGWLDSHFLATQMEESQGHPVEPTTVENIKRQIESSNYRLALYSTPSLGRFLLLAMPTHQPMWGTAGHRPTYALSSDEGLVRKGDEGDQWRRLLGWSHSLEGVDSSVIAKICQKMEVAFSPIPSSSSNSDPELQIVHHLQTEVETIARERTEALLPLAEAVGNLILRHAQAPIPDYNTALDGALSQFHDSCLAWQNEITSCLAAWMTQAHAAQSDRAREALWAALKQHDLLPFYDPSNEAVEELLASDDPSKSAEPPEITADSRGSSQDNPPFSEESGVIGFDETPTSLDDLCRWASQTSLENKEWERDVLERLLGWLDKHPHRLEGLDRARAVWLLQITDPEDNPEIAALHWQISQRVSR